MTPEERASACLTAVCKSLGAWENIESRELIASAIREAVQAERERCAQVAKSLPWADWEMNDGRSDRIVAAIREVKS